VQPAGAKVRIKGNLSASSKNHSTITQKTKTSAKKQPEAEAKFNNDFGKIRGDSAGPASLRKWAIATDANAWLPERIYTVDACLTVEVLNG